MTLSQFEEERQHMNAHYGSIVYYVTLSKLPTLTESQFLHQQPKS